MTKTTESETNQLIFLFLKERTENYLNFKRNILVQKIKKQ